MPSSRRPSAAHWQPPKQMSPKPGVTASAPGASPSPAKPAATGQLEIAQATAQAQTPEHKRFHTLMGKVTQAKARLARWQTELPQFSRLYEAGARPLLKELLDQRRQWAFELEAVLAAQRWNKVDAQTLSELICDLCDGLIDSSEGEPDAELKALFNRHSDIDFDERAQDELHSLKGMLESMGDLDLGDEPVESAEELVAKAREQMAQKHREQQQAGGDPEFGADADLFGNNSFGEAPPRRKNKRASAAEKKAAEEAQRISQTVREVFRKLASALHPDRAEAGISTAALAERTALMQRANSAYEANDLLALLELQLQIEQVDLSQAASIAATQVRHFNKVLAEQLRELEHEIDGLQHTFEMSYGLDFDKRIDPAKLDTVYKEEMRELQFAKSRIEHDRRLFRHDPTSAKRFLKQWRAEQRMMGFDVGYF